MMPSKTKNVMELGARAQEIADSVDMEDRTTAFSDLAAAAEAHLVLGNHDEAVAYTIEFVQRSEADATTIATMLHRFRDDYGLTEVEAPGDRTIPFLQAELLQHNGGRIEHRSAAAKLGRLLRDPLYKAVVGPKSLERVKLLRAGQRRMASVAIVGNSSGGGQGIGVVVDPTDVTTRVDHGFDSNEYLLLAPADAIAGDGADDVQIRFADSEADETYRVASVIEEPSLGSLGLVLVRTEPPLVGRPAMPLAQRSPAPGSRIYAIGHPDGDAAPVALSSCEVVAVDQHEVRYEADAMAVSAGNPVLDGKWQLVGFDDGNTTTRLSAITAVEIDLRESVAAG